jgi:3-oxoacyl-[acyl-carrier-protein] synthase II
VALRSRSSRAASVAARATTADPDAPPRRVVVTGLGVVSPLGNEHDEFYSALLEGRSGVAEISSFDASEFSTRFAGEVKVRFVFFLVFSSGFFRRFFFACGG